MSRNDDNSDGEKLSCETLASLFEGSVEKCESELAKLETLARVLEEKDAYTQAHSSRVEIYAEIIANELGVDENARETIRKAAALHDFGKIGVPDEILTKPSKLTKEEIAVIRQHPKIAAQVLERLLYPKDCVNFVYHHHEWFNGEGYPTRRSGEEIPLGARVIAVADAYDAMTSNRPYRKAISSKRAEHELLDCSGSQFDPDVVKAFCNAHKRGKLKTE